MSKVDDSLKIDEYQAGAYLSLTEFLGRWLTDDQIQKLAGKKLVTYKDWVNNANRTVETVLYEYNDQIPLDKTSETFTYAKSMALHWAQYEKAADEGATNAKAKLKLWEMDKAHIIKTMKAQPQKTTARVVTSSDFTENEVELYSQSYGVSDLL